MKKLLLIILTLSAILSCVACGSGEDAVNEQKFTYGENEFSITLTDAFIQKDYQSYTVCYEASDMVIFVLKEPFSLMDGLDGYSTLQYAGLLREANSAHSPTAISTEDELISFEYGYFNKDENITYTYFTTAFKGSDAFWTVQFACKSENYETLKSEMIKYAKSITLGE